MIKKSKKRTNFPPFLVGNFCGIFVKYIAICCAMVYDIRVCWKQQKIEQDW